MYGMRFLERHLCTRVGVGVRTCLFVMRYCVLVLFPARAKLIHVHGGVLWQK